MRRVFWLPLVLGFFAACSSSDDDDAADGGGGAGNGSCTCDFSVNGVTKSLLCGQSACVNGATATCRADAESDIVPGCSSENPGGSSGSGGSGGTAGTGGSGGTSGSGDGEGGSGGTGGTGGSSGSGGGNVDPEGCYDVSVDGAFVEGPTTSSVIVPVSSTSPFINDKWRLQVSWFKQEDPTVGTYDLSLDSSVPAPFVQLGLVNALGDVDGDSFFGSTGSVVLSELPDPRFFSETAGSLANIKFVRPVVGSGCFRLTQAAWDTR